MERTIINPWTWQDELGYVQANEVVGAQRVLYVSGVASMDADGRLARAGSTPASTLLGVAELAWPELLVEMDAVAVR